MMWSRALFSIGRQQYQHLTIQSLFLSFSLSHIAVLNSLQSIHTSYVKVCGARTPYHSIKRNHFMLRLQNEANACAHKINSIPTKCYYLYDLLIPLHFHLQNNKFVCVRVCFFLSFVCLFVCVFDQSYHIRRIFMCGP